MENIKLLFQMYFRPAFAMSEILDKGSWLFAAVLVLFVSIAFFWTVNAKLQAAYSIPAFYEFYNPDYNTIDEDSPEFQAAYRKAADEYQKALNERRTIPLAGDLFFRFFSFDPTGFLRPVLSLSVFYVPFVILLMSLFGGAGNFGVRLRRDYSALATCTLMAWAAAHLPFAVLGVLLNSAEISPPVFFSFWVISSFLFGVFDDFRCENGVRRKLRDSRFDRLRRVARSERGNVYFSIYFAVAFFAVFDNFGGCLFRRFSRR